MKISVIIPVYNAEKTILETIQSVQNQTFSDFELIIIDDGSTDQSLALVQSINDERVKVYSHQNGGVSRARNLGIAKAQGEFIAFLDNDDLWSANKLELQLQALQNNPEAGVAYSWNCYIDESGSSNFAARPFHFQGNVYGDLLLSNFLLNGSNPLVRREAIEAVGGFNPDLSAVADWDFYLRLAAQWNFVVVPQYQIFYRKSSASMTSKVDAVKAEGLQMLNHCFQTAPAISQAARNASLSQFYKYCANLYLQHGTSYREFYQAGQGIWMAIRLRPQLLLEQDTLLFLAKLTIKTTLPDRAFQSLLQLVRKTRMMIETVPKISH